MEYQDCVPPASAVPVRRLLLSAEEYELMMRKRVPVSASMSRLVSINAAASVLQHPLSTHTAELLAVRGRKAEMRTLRFAFQRIAKVASPKSSKCELPVRMRALAGVPEYVGFASVFEAICFKDVG